MTSAIIIMGGLGLVIGAALAAASKIFYVYVDPMVLAVDDVLPGANCGGCGFPGCGANAEAIVAGTSPPSSCVAAGDETTIAIAELLGVSVEAKEPDIALPGCTYGVQKADQKYLYDGLNDCRAAALLGGGMKVCNIGCLGLGTCAKACPFGAITMGPAGLPVVIEERCTGCGTCERECPKNIISLSSITRRILREYTTADCTTPCQRACPAGIDICGYIKAIQDGDYHKAVQVVKERNPFPSVIGRICPRPCENECRRNLIDEPVAINFLKRFVADYEREQNERVLPYKAPETNRKIAVIGGGVQGLSTAFFAARLGHTTKVFEATDKPGGLLRSAIAANRLPMSILDWDIEGVKEMGVAIETKQALGKDFTVASLLKEGYEAVVLTAGGWDSRLARGAVADVEAPVLGLYLLVDLMKQATPEAVKVPVKGHIAIAGGGKLALQAAQRCKEMGATKVTLLIREKANQVPEMSEEIEGVEKLYGVGISQFYGKNQEITDIEIIDLESLKLQTISTGTVFIAAGRFPELVFSQPKTEAASETEAKAEGSADGPLSWVATPTYKQPAYHEEKGLLAKGDALSDFSAAIKAIAAGRRATVTVHRILFNLPLDLPENVLTPGSPIQNVTSPDQLVEVKNVTRQIMPLCTTPDPVRCEELELGFNETRAKAEADRCLQCGLICYEHTAKLQPAVKEVVAG